MRMQQEEIVTELGWTQIRNPLRAEIIIGVFLFTKYSLAIACNEIHEELL